MSGVPHDLLCKKIVSTKTPPQKIKQIQFSMMSGAEMQRVSEFAVWSQEMYRMPERRPAPNGVLDMRLGVADKAALCKTCSKKVQDCAGHFGHVQLELPLFHIGFFKHTLTVLQCVCKTCSSILLSPTDRERFLSRLRRTARPLDALQKASLLKKIIDKCKKMRECPRCKAYNGSVKKVTGVMTLKLSHEKYKGKLADSARERFRQQLNGAIKHNAEIAQHFNKAQEDLSPLKVLELLKHISDEDAELLWMDPKVGRPEQLILSTLLVPPVPIRPSVAMDTGAGSNEDDLTVKMQEIVGVNNALRDAITKGATVKMLMEDWNFLQVQVAQYLNGETPGVPKAMGEKPIRGLCQRLKGKSGRFRGNLSGKRVDFSARTVISPDPHLRVDQVGVPERVAKIMTYPEMVSRYNIHEMRKLVINGPNVHPGANYIRSGEGGFNKSLMYGNRQDAANKLQIGDIVERHMIDDDVVLFNRQPSLHKLSIMSHRVKVMPWRTFRFNECVCAPYNADFDGDEMNMHLPQTAEARAEAAELMAVPHNLVTPRNGEPLVAATQDFLTASYLLTQKNVFFDREAFCRLAAVIGDGDEEIEIPPPTILKPASLWTGKQIISFLVKPNKSCPVKVNLELKEKNYTKDKQLCHKDGYVIFRNSHLVTGNLAKKTLGDGTKKSLFYVLQKDHGHNEAARCMNRLAKLSAYYMGNRGFSIGIEDVTPSEALRSFKEELVQEGFQKADQNIEQFKEGTLELKPGCDATQSLESELTGILGKVREAAGKMAMNELPWVNAPRIMAECGSKGSVINISQMVACLGQQAVDGKRIQNGFVNRTLPHFQPNSLFPAAKGFVANSFFSGLTATEFFFHTMGGREGLVDTAVKTAQTGYMARRLMKALEDLSLHYDNSVRNSESTVVQFRYGDDGLDPACMEGDDRPIEFGRVLDNIVAQQPEDPLNILSKKQIIQISDSAIASDKFQRLLPEGNKFIDEVREFLHEKADQVGVLASSFGVDLDDASVEMDPSVALDQSAMMARRTIAAIGGITNSQIQTFVNAVLKKYERSHVEPGEAIGALGAQSISEPGTQMTLKTFHFAGVASMNVTLGVPRLTEIINASKLISTPIITAQLVQNDNEYAARLVKGKIEKTTLGQISRSIYEIYAPDSCHIQINLDMNLIRDLHLDVDAHSIRQRILKGLPGQTRPSVLRSLAEKHVQLNHSKVNQIRVLPPDNKKESGEEMTYFTMQALKAALPGVIVQGTPTVSRAVINSEDNADGNPKYNLLVEGYGLADVMGAPGIDGVNTVSNHVLEVNVILGIEAARTKISDEISYIMAAYGIHIDLRHLMLLSDVMTFKGEVLGITRFGVSKMRESVLMLASFEKTTDHLFDAAVHSRRDDIVGVSECIIMGVPIPLGTGLFKLLRDVDRDHGRVVGNSDTIENQLKKQDTVFTL